VIAELEPMILATAARAAASTLDDLGSATILSDIATMRHETLGVRLFIS
jgi:urease accessory protein